MSQFKFTTLGVKLDMTENAVMTPDALKKFMKLIKKMGYNTLLLSLQGACPIPEEPFIGYLRPCYSEEELRELEAYACSIHMEIIPAIRILDTNPAFNRWWQYHSDRGMNCLCADDEKIYTMIERTIDFLHGIFHSKKIHLEMRYEYQIGRGNYMREHGYVERSLIVAKHLETVSKLCRDRGLTPLAYSDMMIDTLNPKKYPKSVIPVALDCVGEGMSPAERLSATKALSPRAWMAGRLYGGTGLIPHNGLTVKKGLPLIDLCREENCRNLYFMCESPDGAECSPFALLPALCYLGQYAKGVTDEDAIKAKFKSAVGMQYDDFIAIDEVNYVAGNEKDSLIPCNPSKYMLYSDLFNGFLDSTVKEGGNEYYEELAEKLHAVARKSRKYGYIFDSAAALCQVLAIKYELGVKTRWSYQKGRKWDLHLYANRAYIQLGTALRRYRDALETQWMNENHPYGFAVTEYRIAGVAARVDSCRRRLSELSDGLIEEIDELKTEILVYPDSNPGESISYNNYAENVSACRYK